MKQQKIDLLPPTIRKKLIRPYLISLIAGPIVFFFVNHLIHEDNSFSRGDNNNVEIQDQVNAQGEDTTNIKIEELNESTLNFIGLNVTAIKDIENEIILIKSHEQTIYEISLKDNGYSIKGANNQELTKVKFKRENNVIKFNIYDHSGNKIFSGKEKKGSIRIKDSNGNIVNYLDGNLDFFSASALQLPIEDNQIKLILYQVILRWVPKSPEEDGQEEEE